MVVIKLYIELNRDRNLEIVIKVQDQDKKFLLGKQIYLVFIFG